MVVVTQVVVVVVHESIVAIVDGVVVDRLVGVVAMVVYGVLVVTLKEYVWPHWMKWSGGCRSGWCAC